MRPAASRAWPTPRRPSTKPQRPRATTKVPGLLRSSPGWGRPGNSMNVVTRPLACACRVFLLLGLALDPRVLDGLLRGFQGAPC